MIRFRETAIHMERFIGYIFRKETVMEEEKKTVLDDNAIAEAAGGEDSVPENTTCPKCGSTNVTYALWAHKFFCLDCNYMWR